MSDLGTRSASQVLRTFLPQQTADLRGGIYRVTDWPGAAPLSIDDASVRRRLLREIHLWEQNANDSGFAADLRRQQRLEVVELDTGRGVAVERYPRVWLCPRCKRVGRDHNRPCVCGNSRWGQLHFLGFHECGAVGEPRIPRCPTHDEVELVGTTSTRTSDLRFVCPRCHLQLQKGLGFQQCQGCRQGGLHWNVHKARTAYTPRGMVMVNPARPERMQALGAAGGPAKALDWVLDGMQAHSPTTVTGLPSASELRAQLLANNMAPAMVDVLVQQAAQMGQLAQANASTPLDTAPTNRREAVEQEAVDIALALGEARMTISHLTASPGSMLANRYANDYPAAIQRAGLAGVDLVESFPVLNVMYGYTRGDSDPASCRLVPFRHPKREGYRLLGDLAETEALLVRLDPLRVARWLTARGHGLPGWSPGDEDARQVRAVIAAASDIPGPGDMPATPTVGADILTLVHSYAHRMIRQTAVFAGIDRDALNEYLVPSHLGFFLYASPRGDFVLGGLQSVFETNLDQLLDTVTTAESRCPLDPGCARGAGACSACLHLGETSCRAYNTFLDRRGLFAAGGYLR
ncbi:hypothetical protein [Petropleomorpha daqingensis]|uniref:DUF1998 domain-containing protein n=1 Tax=Petropleomorpha daqingensis TaxID=2026353 RepID=A0A853C7C2_9ACTN|nr:hypothetical protein [Petropleomorpha daqingensis]NYJ03920.1 hypothetical protein [Petropleomorpha daqingensis]